MAINTKSALAASFKKLLRKTTLDKITVKDIVEDCGVNRQTFYYHFKDIYDLIEWIFAEEAQNILLRENPSFDEDYFARVFEYLNENRTLIANAYNSVGREYFEEYLFKLIRPLINDYALKCASELDIDKEDFDFVVNIYSSGFIFLAFVWLNHSMDTDYSKDLHRFFVVLDGSLEVVLEKLAKH